MSKYYYRNNLKYLRKLHNMTQKELGQKMGVGYSTVSRWEKGDNDININIATKLSQIFDVQVFHFLYSDLETYEGEYRGFKPLFEEYKIVKQDERELIDLYRTLNESHKIRLFEIIRFYIQEQ